jgi:hypothetical protein
MNANTKNTKDLLDPGVVERAPSHQIEWPVQSHELTECHGFTVDVEHVSKEYFTSKYFVGTYVAHCSTFLGGLGGFNLIAPILSYINADVGPSENILWLALVYTMGLAVGLSLMGRITDIFGRRWFMVCANLLGTVSAIVHSRAQSVNVLIGGRNLIGPPGLFLLLSSLPSFDLGTDAATGEPNEGNRFPCPPTEPSDSARPGERQRSLSASRLRLFDISGALRKFKRFRHGKYCQSHPKIQL